MSSRPTWKGNISFGLVNIPVVLFSAEQSYELRFKLLDKRNLAKVHYKRINEETGKDVPWGDIVKGYEVEKGDFVVLTDEDFKTVAIENLKTIEIEDFIPADQLPPIYYERPYFILPDKKGDKGYVLLRETLANSKKVGIARVMIRTRQYLAAILPLENAIVINVIRYPQELRELESFNFPDKSLKDYKISKKEIEIADQLVKAMSINWDPKRYEDDYHDALVEWIDKKYASGNQRTLTKTKKGTATKQTNVVDFMDLLKKSISEKKRRPARRGKVSTPPKPRGRTRKAAVKKSTAKKNRRH